jgi:hypothetical protein
MVVCGIIAVLFVWAIYKLEMNIMKDSEDD